MGLHCEWPYKLVCKYFLLLKTISSEPDTSNYCFFFCLLVNSTLAPFFTVHLQQASIIFWNCKCSLGFLISNLSDLSQFVPSLSLLLTTLFLFKLSFCLASTTDFLLLPLSLWHPLFESLFLNLGTQGSDSLRSPLV